MIAKNEELDKALIKAEKAARAKSEFLALMSHEITYTDERCNWNDRSCY